MNTNQKAVGVGRGWGENTKEEEHEETRKRNVCCTVAEHLLSLETTAQPGGTELFPLDHEIEQQCPENV